MTAPPITAPTLRLTSLDAYRGFVMLAMASAGFGLAKVFGDDSTGVWRSVALQFEHVEWSGGVFWDMIQPSFMFMVGASMPFSYGKRAERGDSFLSQLVHALARSLVLVLLGVLLASKAGNITQTNWLFTNVLAQIGLGYTFAFLLVNRWLWLQLAALAAILIGSWAAFAYNPLPDDGFSLDEVSKPPNQRLAEPFAPWSPHDNFAGDVDRVLLNWFPRSEPWVYQAGGYQTLNFIPSLATMILGLLAGRALRSNSSAGVKLVVLIVAGAVCLGLGLAAHETLVPIVKRIWTPSWVLYSGAWCFWLMAGFYLLFDMLPLKPLAFPLVVVGMNSIAIYMMSQLISGWIVETLEKHVHSEMFAGDYGPIWQAVAVLLVLWLICWWLYRQRIFLRI